MSFDPIATLQAFTDNIDERPLKTKLETLSKRDLKNLRDHIDREIGTMPKEGDPKRLEKLIKLRALLQDSIRTMMWNLAATVASDSLTHTLGAGKEREEPIPVEENTKEESTTVEETSSQTISAFETPNAEELKADKRLGNPTGEALGFDTFKKIIDPTESGKGLLHSTKTYLSYGWYRLMRFMGAHSHGDGLLAKVFRFFGGSAARKAAEKMENGNASAPKTPTASSYDTKSEKRNPVLPTEPVPAPKPEETPKPIVPATEKTPPEEKPVEAKRASFPDLFSATNEGKDILDGTTYSVGEAAVSFPMEGNASIKINDRKFQIEGAKIFGAHLPSIGPKLLRLSVQKATMHNGNLVIVTASKDTVTIQKKTLENIANEIRINTKTKITLEIPISVDPPGKPPKNLHTMTLLEVK